MRPQVLVPGQAAQLRPRGQLCVWPVLRLQRVAHHLCTRKQTTGAVSADAREQQAVLRCRCHGNCRPPMLVCWSAAQRDMKPHAHRGKVPPWQSQRCRCAWRRRRLQTAWRHGRTRWTTGWLPTAERWHTAPEPPPATCHWISASIRHWCHRRPAHNRHAATTNGRNESETHLHAQSAHGGHLLHRSRLLHCNTWGAAAPTWRLSMWVKTGSILRTSFGNHLETAKVGEDGQHAGELCEALWLYARRHCRHALRPLPLCRRLDLCRDAVAGLLRRQGAHSLSVQQHLDFCRLGHQYMAALTRHCIAVSDSARCQQQQAASCQCSRVTGRQLCSGRAGPPARASGPAPGLPAATATPGSTAAGP